MRVERMCRRVYRKSHIKTTEQPVKPMMNNVERRIKRVYRMLRLESCVVFIIDKLSRKEEEK
jgi:hypothetical protein